MAKTIAELFVISQQLNGRVESSLSEIADLWAEVEQFDAQNQALRIESAVYREQIAALQKETERQRQRAEEAERKETELRREHALLAQRFDDHLKRVEEWDRRRWGMIGLLVGAILSFSANLVVALVRK